MEGRESVRLIFRGSPTSLLLTLGAAIQAIKRSMRRVGPGKAPLLQGLALVDKVTKLQEYVG